MSILKQVKHAYYFLSLFLFDLFKFPSMVFFFHTCKTLYETYEETIKTRFLQIGNRQHIPKFLKWDFHFVYNWTKISTTHELRNGLYTTSHIKKTPKIDFQHETWENFSYLCILHRIRFFWCSCLLYSPLFIYFTFFFNCLWCGHKSVTLLKTHNAPFSPYPLITE
jgi:hypothetical protein